MATPESTGGDRSPAKGPIVKALRLKQRGPRRFAWAEEACPYVGAARNHATDQE